MAMYVPCSSKHLPFFPSKDRYLLTVDCVECLLNGHDRGVCLPRSQPVAFRNGVLLEWVVPRRLGGGYGMRWGGVDRAGLVLPLLPLADSNVHSLGVMQSILSQL